MEENKSFRLINNCRLCNSSKLKNFINLGEIPLGNNLQTNQEIALKCDAYPLKIIRCKNCNHFQLSIAVDPKLLYAQNYTYLSGIGLSFVSHLESYANWAYEEFNLKENSLIVDIGSNDGTCLKFFKEKNCRVLGVDPASKPAEIANKNGIDTINAFFDKSIADLIVKKYGPVDLITSHNALAHVDNLQDVFKNIYSIIKEGGIFIFEIGYFKMVLESGCFDTTYHEHLDYHHAAPLVNHLEKLGFTILDIKTNSIQGGSLRFITQKRRAIKTITNVNNFLEIEKKSTLYNYEFLNNWETQIKKSMKVLEIKIKEFHKSNNIIAGYGAPTKASLLLSMANLDLKEIKFILEDNPLKVGRFMPKTGIPIVDKDFLNANKPDIMIILAWNFSTEIIEKLRSFVNWPMKCIIPLPKLEIVDINK